MPLTEKITPKLRLTNGEEVDLSQFREFFRWQIEAQNFPLFVQNLRAHLREIWGEDWEAIYKAGQEVLRELRIKNWIYYPHRIEFKEKMGGEYKFEATGQLYGERVYIGRFSNVKEFKASN